jgi:hypothetical protein
MHALSLGIDASPVKAHMPAYRRQTCLMPTHARKTLSNNLAWIRDNTAINSQPKMAKLFKVDQKTVGRILNDANAATLDSIQAIADAMKIEPWQLLAPKFGEGLLALSGTTLVPAARPTVTAKAPQAGKDRLGLPHFTVAPAPAAAPATEPVAKAPRAGKPPGGNPPKRGERAARPR